MGLTAGAAGEEGLSADGGSTDGTALAEARILVRGQVGLQVLSSSSFVHHTPTVPLYGPVVRFSREGQGERRSSLSASFSQNTEGRLQQRPAIAVWSILS